MHGGKAVGHLWLFSTADRSPSSKRVEIVDDFGSVSVEQCNSQVSYLYGTMCFPTALHNTC